MNGSRLQPAQSPFPAGSCRSLETRDAAEMAAWVEGVGWSARYFPSTPARFDAALNVVHTSRAQLADVRFRAPALACGQGPEGAYVFVISHRTSGHSRFCGERLGPEVVGLIRPGVEFDFRSSDPDERLLLMAMSMNHVERGAFALLERSVAEIGDRPTLPTTARRSFSTLLACSHGLLEAALAEPARLRDLPTALQLEEDLACGLLRSIAPAERLSPGPDRRRAARRGAAYLREEFNRSITLAEVCRAAGVSERTLRQGFQEVLGMSPIAYLKQIRLLSARIAIRESGRSPRVSDIALQSGFEHFGRFSVEYRRAFGESPSETIPGPLNSQLLLASSREIP